ncbi:MAG: hypothetical protein ACRBCI_15555 [Cellvibrionaceae bacterium]
MKPSSKAASLSAFLFPGSGHMFLKCYIRGIIFIAIAGVGLFLMMEAAFSIAWTIANDIDQGKVAFDVNSIRSVVEQTMAVYKDPSLQGAKWAIIVSWIVSTADAYREGKKQETATAQ